MLNHFITWPRKDGELLTSCLELQDLRQGIVERRKDSFAPSCSGEQTRQNGHVLGDSQTKSPWGHV